MDLTPWKVWRRIGAVLIVVAIVAGPQAALAVAGAGFAVLIACLLLFGGGGRTQ